MNTSTTPWRDIEARALAGMNEAERAEFDAAEAEEEMRLQLAELVYQARTSAGLSQTELARRAGTRQSVISSIENGGQVPTVPMLWRVARALGRELRIEIDAA
ncbi:helix-turn-helix transcriptional regulator [Specibacter cremeus]|uniref:helix-turn-helix transcriptional regulator n=1 Tax=Specibacter cremeus TaxID=1629051 RepID=UPI000F79F881|nr:helix-turn-helix transcriptional regulator [Specibacter cremeus]